MYTSNLVCIKMASILTFESIDLEIGGTFSNHFEVMKSLARLKDQAKSLVYKILINVIDFHSLSDGIMKFVLPSFSEVLQGKSVDFPAKNMSSMPFGKPRVMCAIITLDCN